MRVSSSSSGVPPNYVRYNIENVLHCVAVPAAIKDTATPISLRLPSDIDAQITGFGARQGLTKSAVIVRSIQEFLARNAQPTSLQIYQDAMRGAPNAAVQRENQHERDDAFRAAAEVRPHKLQVRQVIRSKHAKRATRSGAAVKAIQAPQTETGGIPPSRKPRKAA